MLKCLDVSLQTQIIHTVTIYVCENWTVRKGWQENHRSIWNVVLQENFVDTLSGQKDEQVDQARTISGGKFDETEAVLLWAHHEKARISEKDNNNGKGWMQQEKRKT